MKSTPEGGWNRTWNHMLTRTRSLCFAQGNSKLQILNSKQYSSSNFKIPNGFPVLNLLFWSLWFVCDLALVICDFLAQSASDAVPIEEWANELFCIARLSPIKRDAGTGKPSFNRAHRSLLTAFVTHFTNYEYWHELSQWLITLFAIRLISFHL